LNNGIKEGRQSSPKFSIRAYLDRYPDVRKSVGSTNYPAALKHWLRFGREECRDASPEGFTGSYGSDPRLAQDIFDSRFYLLANQDVCKVFGMNDAKAVEHWLNNGIKEGRQSSPKFSIRAYLDRYPDVKKLVGATNYLGALKHWIDNGRREGRNPRP